MKASAFELPDDTIPQNLLVERMNETTLKPDSPVVALNRGRNELVSTFNGEHITIPAGLFVTEYRAAKHFQDRLVVPGTRNLEVGGHVSWIAILGSEDRRLLVDPVEMHVPFTDDELQTFGESVEAIDRRSVLGPGRDVMTIRTQTARARSRAQGFESQRPQIDTGQQASEAAAEAAEHVFDPPVGSATRASEQDAATDPEAAGVEPAPRAMRTRSRQ